MNVFLRWWRPPVTGVAHTADKVLAASSLITPAPSLATTSAASVLYSTVAAKATGMTSTIVALPMASTLEQKLPSAGIDTHSENGVVFRTVMSLLAIIFNLFQDIVLGIYSLFSGFVNTLVTSFLTAVTELFDLIHDVRCELNLANFGTDVAHVVCLLAGLLMLFLLMSWLAPSRTRRRRRMSGAKPQQPTPGLSTFRMQHQNDVFRLRYQLPSRHRRYSTGSAHRRNHGPLPPLTPIHPIAGCRNANTLTRLTCNSRQKLCLLFTAASQNATQYTGLTQGTMSLLLLTGIFIITAYTYDVTWPTELNETDIHFFLWCGRRTGAIWCVIHCFRNRELAIPFLSYLGHRIQHMYWSGHAGVSASWVYAKDMFAWISSALSAALQTLLAHAYAATFNGMRACGRMVASTASAGGNLLTRLGLTGLDYLRRFLTGFALFAFTIAKEIGLWGLAMVLTGVDKFFNYICKLQAEHWDPARDERDKALKERDAAVEELGKTRQEKNNYRTRAHKNEQALARRDVRIHDLEKDKLELLGLVNGLKTDLGAQEPSRRQIRANYDAEVRRLKIKLSEATAETDRSISEQREKKERAWAAECASYKQRYGPWIDVKDQEIDDLESEIKTLRGFLKKAGVKLSKDGTTADFTSMPGSLARERNLVNGISASEKALEKSEALSGRRVAELEWYRQDHASQKACREEAEAKATRAEERVTSLEKRLEEATAKAQLAQTKADTKALEEVKTIKSNYARLEKSHNDLQTRFNVKEKSHNDLEKICTDKDKRCTLLEKEQVVLSGQKGEAESRAARLIVDKDELAKDNASLKATNANLSKENVEISQDRQKLKSTVAELEATLSATGQVPDKAAWEKIKRAKFNEVFPNGEEAIDVGSDHFLCAMAAISTSMQIQNVEGVQATVPELVESYEKHRVEAKLPDSKGSPMLTYEQIGKFFHCWSKDTGKKAAVGAAVQIGNRRRVLSLRPEDVTMKIIWIYKKTDDVSDRAAYDKLAATICWQALAPKKEAPKGNGDKPRSGDGQKGDTQKGNGASQPPSGQQPPGDNKNANGNKPSGDGKPADTSGPSGDNSGSGNDATSGSKISKEKQEYDRYREIFDATFPHGFDVLETASAGELCGFYAIIKTISSMFPKTPCPTIEELSDTLASQACQHHFTTFVPDRPPPKKFFSPDELAVILDFWAKPKSLVMRVGCIKQLPSAKEAPFFSKPYITGENNPNATVVWIHNNGAENALAHWSGMQPKVQPSVSS
ncbi:MAG: hypothetical protein Q9208_002754 [Pyrenodesmia sp. 3 TL-2023]